MIVEVAPPPRRRAPPPTIPAKLWGTPVERERRNRIKVALWAYAYEVKSAPLVDDKTFDDTCLLIDPQVTTGHKKLDAFFRTEFAPHTGQWIWAHPELHRVAVLFDRLTKNPAEAMVSAEGEDA